MSRTRVFPREVGSILTRTGGYLSGFTHSLQPYAGCGFSCRYCYVREMAVQRANPFGLPWGHWLVPKTNAPELLSRAARGGRLRAARIFCSSATDPYVPQERRLRVTRACLEILAGAPPEVLVLQTRSPDVVRDADLLRRIPGALASVSVTTDDERVRRLLEPDSPSIPLRIEALARLRAAGIRTQAAVSPLLPCDPEHLAVLLEPHVDRVVLDDFFRGDGAGGRRSRDALALLRSSGHTSWSEPGYAERAAALFRRVLGPERVVESQAGFNDVSWLL